MRWIRLRSAGMLLALLALITLGITSMAQAAPAAAFAAAASVSPQVQYLNDTTGTVFTFTIHNTGTTASIGAVEIDRPSNQWTIVGCPLAPAGWSATRSDTMCRYRSADSTSDDIKAGQSNSQFQVKATTLPGSADRPGTWKVAVSKSNQFDTPSLLSSASPEGTGLGITAYSWQILDALVDATPNTAGSACPSATAANHSAITGSSGHTILICGKNRMTVAATPIASRSSLGGTFIASAGTFTSGSIAANSASSVVLGKWSNVTITSSAGTGKTIIAKTGSAANQTSPLTTLTGYEAKNQPPTAGNDSYSTNEDTLLSIAAPGVLSNDSDPDGDPITAVQVTGPSHASSFTLNANGSFSYTPAANYNGPDSFTYKAQDSFGAQSGTATVNIIVNAVDDSPTAVNDAATVSEDAGATAIDVLANDTDVDAGPKSIASVVQPANGTVAITGGGTGLTYKPNANYCNSQSGGTPDSFIYTLTPGGSTATVSVTVTCVDDAPTAVDDSATVTEDVPATPIDVLANDTDVDGGPKSVTSVTQPANGTVAITGGGTGLTYKPNANYCNSQTGGTADAFTYTLTPGGSTATVSVTVTCVNDDPVANNDTATVAEDASATAINVLANDTDPENDAFTIDTVTQPMNGAVVITGGGTGLTYQPNANYCNSQSGGTPDSFTYTLTPGGSSATVSVTVTCVDDAPTAVNDSATVNEDSGANAIDVLANDTDVDGGPKSITSVMVPANGAVVITGGGTGLTYQPNANYCNSQSGGTPDSFSYTLTPGGSTATVSVTVTCVDDAPTAVDDSATVNQNTGANAINVLANDTDVDGGPKSINTVTQPENGTVAITGGGTGLTYQPNANYCNDPPGTSPDTFDYTLSPGSSSATVSVTVSCDASPVAVDDSATVAEDASATSIDVLANDTDADGGPKSIASVVQPANGTVAITGGGTGLTYQPDANYCNSQSGGSPDTFTYTLSPGGSTATVSVTVTCVDDAPTAVNDSATVTEDASATAIDVLANDTDVDGGPKSVTSVIQPANGTVAITGGGTGLTYKPNANYCNSQSGGTPDTFSYTLTPGGSSAAVSVTVTCVDDAPTAVNDSATVAEDAGATAIDVLANDTDPENDAFTIDTTTQPTNGTVAITGGGTGLTYKPNANYCNSQSGGSPDTFTYTLSPGGSTATVSVTVTCVDDAPTAVNDSATVTEDDPATAINVLANDTDVDGGPKSIASVVQPANGTVAITGGGTGLTYQPNANYCNSQSGGTADTFTYTLTPGGSSATVTVIVTCVNDAPVAVNDSYSVAEDGSLSPAAPGVLTNDTDAENDLLTAVLVIGPAHAQTFALNPDGSFSYAPVANYNGSDSFTYKAHDATLDSNTATVNITVTPVNDAPANTVPAAQTVNEDTDLTFSGASTISIADIDAGGSSVKLSLDVLHGTLTLATNSGLTFVDGTANGTGSVHVTGTIANINTALNGLKYKGVPNYNGSDTLTVVTNDQGNTGSGGALSDTDTVGITVNPVNDAPVVTAPAAFSIQANMQRTGLTGLLANVTDADSGVNGCAPTFTVTNVSATTPAGGNITNLNASTGTFDFDPPPGFTGGNVTFTYTVTDNGCPGTATSAPATVTLNVSGPVIWFVDDSAPAGGTGRLSAPFNTLAAAGTAIGSSTSHRIFLYNGTYTTGRTLNSGEWLIGQGVSGFADFDTLMGIAPPAGTIARPAIATGTATVQGTVTLASSVVVKGLALSTGAATGMNDPVGAITGVNVDQVAVTTTTGTGVNLSDIAGTLNFSNLTTSGGAGANLTGSNGSATFNFISVSVSSGANNAFVATGGGTVNVTGANNTLTTTTGTALNVTNTTIGASGLTFKTISSNGAANGIVLNTTGGSGGLTLTGDGANTNNGSGGTIQNTTGHAIRIANARSVSLGYLNITNPGLSAILVAPSGWTYGNDATLVGTGVNNFTLNRSNISDNAGNNSLDDGLTLENAAGTLSITNNSINAARHQGITIDSLSGTISSLTLTGNSVTNTPGGDGVLIQMRGNSVMTSGTIGGATASLGNTFSNNSATGLQVNNADTGNIQSLNVQNNTVSGNNAGMDFDLGQSSSMTITVQNNTFTSQRSSALNMVQSTSSTAGTLTASLKSNSIGTAGVLDSGSAIGSGIRVANGGVNINLTIDSNVIREVPNGRGIDIEPQAYTVNANVKAKITNNTIARPSGTNQNIGCGANVPCPSASIFVLSDNNTVGGFDHVCTVVSGNSAYDPTSWAAGGEAAYYFARRTTTSNTLTLEGTGTPSSWILGNNTVTNSASAPFVDEGAPTMPVVVVAAGTCGSFPP